MGLLPNKDRIVAMNRAERKALRQAVSGDVLFQREILRFYSVDASTYQVVPEAVVVPKDERDVAAAVKFAKKFGKSVTARGAGTGLAGNSLNRGIILDMGNLDSAKIQKDSVTVGPGATKGALDEELKKSGKFFAPNPSVGRYCTIGGMLGNNSSGSRSLKYGSTLDNLISVTFIDGNGNKVTLPQDAALGRKILALGKKINWDKMPRVTKNSSGYRIERLDSINATHKVIAGSEGTLGIVVSAKLRLRDIPLKRRLYVIEYGSHASAAKDCASMLETGPSAVEFVDAQTLRDFELGLRPGTACLLFVEYDSDLGRKDKLPERTKGSLVKVLDSEEDIQHWWRMRDMSLHYSLKSIDPGDRVPHVIEDAVVPVERLKCLFELIDELNSKFGTRTITYGHAGNGNIHVRLLHDRHDARTVRKIARYYFERVIKMGGSISGEHGDGLARTEFVRMLYGKENYEIFEQLKRLLDPHGVLNPGKILLQRNT